MTFKTISYFRRALPRAFQKDVTLHVVLEPRFPFDVKLPDGPHYTVMAYNVHGYHSGPGAKATFLF